MDILSKEDSIIINNSKEKIKKNYKLNNKSLEKSIYYEFLNESLK